MACAAVARNTLAATAPKDKVLAYAVSLIDAMVEVLLDEASMGAIAADVPAALDEELLDAIPNAPEGVDLAFTMPKKDWKVEVDWSPDEKKDELTKAAMRAGENWKTIEERMESNRRAAARNTARKILETLRKNGIHPELVKK